MPEIQTKEARIILAIEAIRSTKKMSMRRAALIYNVPLTSLSDRIHGRTPKPETRPPLQLFTEIEEEVLVLKILDLDARGFSPSISMVEDMANSLLAVRSSQRVGCHGSLP